MSGSPVLLGMACVAVLAACGNSAAGAAAGATPGTDVGGNPGKADAAAAVDGPTAAKDAAANADVAATQCIAPGKGACDSATECATGQYCDPCLRVCADARDVCEPCSADIQCKNAVVDNKPASACLGYATGGNFCGRACLSAAGCPQGYTCEVLPGVAAMQCVPKSKSCAPNSGACKMDGDCPFTTVCNPEYGLCTKGCTDDAVCVTGKVCSLGHCTDPCAADADCQKIAAEAKCTDKKCKIPGGCLGSEECVEKATHCDAKTHKCAPGCVTDGDCKDVGMQCDSGKCTAKGCTMNWQCPFAHVCDPASGQCKKAEGLYCAVCDPKDQDAKACGGKPNACFQFKDAQNQDKGAFCGITCGSDPSGPCPQGWACQETKDDKGQSQGKFCLRPCYNTPVPAGGGTNP